MSAFVPSGIPWHQFQAWVVGGGEDLLEQGAACQNVLESQEVATETKPEGEASLWLRRPRLWSQSFLSAFEVLGQIVQPPSEPMVFSLPLLSKFPLHKIPRPQRQLLRLPFYLFFFF